MRCTIDDLWYKRDPATGKKTLLTSLGERMMARPAKQRGDRWRVRYPNQTGSKTFKTERDAYRHASEVEVNGVPAKSSAGGDEWDKATGTVRQYAERWRAAQGHRATTGEGLERKLNLHVYPILGDRVMNKVKTIDIQEWIGKLRAGRPDEQPPRAPLAGTTVATIRAHVKAIFTDASNDGHIDVNPFAASAMKKKKMKAKSTRRRALEYPPPTAAEIRAAADALPPRYRALVLVAAGSGLRQGELWGLEPEHVDLESGKINVFQQVQMVGTRRYLAPLKSESGRREVEIASYARDALAHHIKEFPPIDVLVDDDRDEDRPGRVKLAKLIFTTADRREPQPLNRAQWAHQWVPARKRAGVSFRFHDLRHYYATVLIESGKDPVEVADALGDSNVQLVLDTYAGYWRKSDESQRSALDKNWFAA